LRHDLPPTVCLVEAISEVSRQASLIAAPNSAPYEDVEQEKRPLAADVDRGGSCPAGGLLLIVLSDSVALDRWPASVTGGTW
jgi:hypothetical protein